MWHFLFSCPMRISHLRPSWGRTGKESWSKKEEHEVESPICHRPPLTKMVSAAVCYSEPTPRVWHPSGVDYPQQHTHTHTLVILWCANFNTYRQIRGFSPLVLIHLVMLNIIHIALSVLWWKLTYRLEVLLEACWVLSWKQLWLSPGLNHFARNP